MIPRESIPSAIALAASPFIGAEAALCCLAGASLLHAWRPDLCIWLWDVQEYIAPPPPFLPEVPTHGSPFHEWDDVGVSHYLKSTLVATEGGRDDYDDGDSILCRTNGFETVRFRGIGFDTAETLADRRLDERRAQQCATFQCGPDELEDGAQEAKSLARQALSGCMHVITNNREVCGGPRLWALIWFEHSPGRWCELGELMVSRGLARVMGNHPGLPRERLERLLKMQQTAQNERRGLWQGWEWRG